MNTFKQYHVYRHSATLPRHEEAKHFASLAWHPLGKMVREWQNYANEYHRLNERKLSGNELADWVLIAAGLRGLVESDTDTLDKQTVRDLIDETLREESA